MPKIYSISLVWTPYFRLDNYKLSNKDGNLKCQCRNNQTSGQVDIHILHQSSKSYLTVVSNVLGVRSSKTSVNVSRKNFKKFNFGLV
mgnify:CR=1 FL=1